MRLGEGGEQQGVWAWVQNETVTALITALRQRQSVMAVKVLRDKQPIRSASRSVRGEAGGKVRQEGQRQHGHQHQQQT